MRAAHARPSRRFFVRHGQCHVHDDGSSHGTHVNGRRLSAGEAVALSPGDSIMLGHVRPIELSVHALEPSRDAQRDAAHAPPGDLFSRLGSEDLLRLVLLFCDLPALRAAKATEKRMARLCRETIRSREWRGQPSNMYALRLMFWEEGKYKLHAPRGHGGAVVRAVAIGSGLLASGGDDGYVRIWGESSLAMKNHPGSVMAVAISAWWPGGALDEHGDPIEHSHAMVATGCADGVVRLWRPSGSLAMRFCAHRPGVTGVAFVKQAACHALGATLL